MLKHDDATHAYAGLCRQCNGWRLLCTDVPGLESDTAQEVAAAIRSGCQLERMLIEDARKIAMCACLREPE